MQKKVKPLKHLGQNFLTSTAIAKKIVLLLGNIKNQNIYEIGSGMGALTIHLVNSEANLTCFDVDIRAVKYLEEKYKDFNNIKIIHSDIRQIKFENIEKSSVSVIGNIPYNITNDILFWLLDNSEYINIVVLTMQREVAERYTAKPNTKQYGITTLALKLYGKAKIYFHIPAGAFFPKPKVMSSVLFIDFSDRKLYENVDKVELLRFIRVAFSQRRKILSNSLKNYFAERNIDVSKMDISYLKMRAEQLTLEDYIDFWNKIRQ
jgi:16S rRNA (adenine1518-N6/adenine1519-N6)-dimethyltransferase